MLREPKSLERTCLFMARKHADQLTFRESLINLLKQGQWPAVSNESEQELANRLGVTLELLQQAVRERVAELKQEGKHPRQLGNGAFKRDYAVVEVTMPTRVYADWKALCGAHRVERSTVLRTLIHRFLLAPSRPRTIGSAWHYENELFKIKVKGRGHAKTRVTRAARIALKDYAERWNVTVTGIVRGMITDALEARKLPARINMISVAGMYCDAAQYLSGAPPDPPRP